MVCLSLNIFWAQSHLCLLLQNTVKHGDKDRFDKEQIGVKEWPIANLLHKDKEHFKVTKKFLITKFDCTLFCMDGSVLKKYTN